MTPPNFPKFDPSELEPKALKKMSEIKAAGEKVGVALSGGADSVFALFVCAKFFGAENCVALHYNHDVRPTALRDQNFCESLCRALGVKFAFKKRSEPLKKTSEDALRKLRHEFFKSACAAEKIKSLALGHIKNDIPETMLMRLLRGASAKALCAPRAVSEKSGLIYFRPVLSFGKAEIKSRLSAAGIEWVEDETNAECVFLRNSLRVKLLPLLAEISGRDPAEAFARTRRILEENDDFLREIFDRGAEILRGGKIRFKSPEFLKAPLVRRAVGIMERASGFELSAKSADAFIKLAAQNLAARANAKDGFLIFDPKTSSIEFLKNPKPLPAFFVELRHGENVLPGGSKIIMERAEISPDEFRRILAGGFDEASTAFIRPPGSAIYAKNIEKGDAYAPLGLKIKKSVLSMMSAKKTPVLKRKTFPLVCFKNAEGIWAPTLAPSESLKLSTYGLAIRLTYIDNSYEF